MTRFRFAGGGRRHAGTGPGWATLLHVALGVAAVLAALLAPPARAGELELSPSSGGVGASVTASHPVGERCATFRVRWDGDDGEVLAATGAAGGGTATVSFEVPAAPTGNHQVVATCEDEDGEETVVGQGTFLVASPIATTTSTSTSVPTLSTTGPDATVPTTATTSPPPPPPPETFAECERRARAAQANAVYQPQRTMTVGGTHPVVAALVLNPTDPTLTLPGPGQTTVVPLPPSATGCLMEARLIGSDFEVLPPEPQRQSFREATVLTWTWQVRPTREGPDLPLVLRLQPLFREEGADPLPGQEQVFEAIIRVDARPRSLWARVGSWISAVFGNELVRYLLLPGGGGVVTLWLAQRWRARKAARDPS